MIRFTVVFLLFAHVSWAQGVDDWITEALDPRLGPRERLKRLDQIIKDGGVDKLAARGLAAENESEVVNAVVDTLFATGHGVKKIESIIRLLVTPHEKKVARRIQVAAEEGAVARELHRALQPFAIPDETHKAFKEAQLRIAAVRALRQIPQRAAVQTMVSAWLNDEDLGVKKACKDALRNVLIAENAEAARDYLALHSDSYRDLRDRVFDALRKKNAALSDYVKEGLRQAPASQCFKVLRGGGESERVTAATRLTELARKREYGNVKPEGFARIVFNAFLKEIDSGVPDTVEALLGTLAVLVNGGKEPPLRGADNLAALHKAVGPLALKKDWVKVGQASVELLGVLGLPAVIPLVEFAGHSDSVEVRKAAVNKLGTLARLGTQERNFIGNKLVELLEAEKNPEIRRLVLGNLRSAPVKNALKPIRAYLKGTTLSESEVEYCIDILRRLESDEALQTLLDVASNHKSKKLRLYAVQEGLLLRKVSPDEDKRILDGIERTALNDPDQDIRAGVVKALGERGSAQAYDLLRKLAAVEALKDDAVAATLHLAERMAKNAEGIETAGRAVRDGVGGDLDRIDKLANAIVRTCDKAKKAAGDIRYLRAKIYADRAETKRPDRLQRYREATARAKDDGLDPELHVDLCVRYKTELLKDPATPENLKDAIACLEKLAKLAGDEQATVAGHLLEATTIATVRLKDYSVAKPLFDEAKTRGAEEKKLAELKKQIDQLEKPS